MVVGMEDAEAVLGGGRRDQVIGSRESATGPKLAGRGQGRAADRGRHGSLGKRGECLVDRLERLSRPCAVLRISRAATGHEAKPSASWRRFPVADRLGFPLARPCRRVDHQTDTRAKWLSFDFGLSFFPGFLRAREVELDLAPGDLCGSTPSLPRAAACPPRPLRRRAAPGRGSDRDLLFGCASTAAIALARAGSTVTCTRGYFEATQRVYRLCGTPNRSAASTFHVRIKGREVKTRPPCAHRIPRNVRPRGRQAHPARRAARALAGDRRGDAVERGDRAVLRRRASGAAAAGGVPRGRRADRGCGGRGRARTPSAARRRRRSRPAAPPLPSPPARTSSASSSAASASSTACSAGSRGPSTRATRCSSSRTPSPPAARP